METFPTGIIASCHTPRNPTPQIMKAFWQLRDKAEARQIRTQMYILTEKLIFEQLAARNSGFPWGKFFADKSPGEIMSINIQSIVSIDTYISAFLLSRDNVYTHDSPTLI